MPYNWENRPMCTDLGTLIHKHATNNPTKLDNVCKTSLYVYD